VKVYSKGRVLAKAMASFVRVKSQFSILYSIDSSSFGEYYPF
jgi:hypothetical protein